MNVRKRALVLVKKWLPEQILCSIVRTTPDEGVILLRQDEVIRMLREGCRMTYHKAQHELVLALRRYRSTTNYA